MHTQRTKILFRWMLVWGLFLHGIPAIPAQEAASGQERVSGRTQDSKTFELPDGSFQVMKTAGAFHFLNSSGQWEDFQKDLSVEGEPARAGLFRSDLPIRTVLESGVNEFPLRTDGVLLRTALQPRMEILDAAGEVLLSAPGPAVAPAHTIAGNRLVLHEFFPGTDRLQRFSYDHLATDFRLNSRPEGLVQGGFVVFSETWELPEGTTLLREYGVEREGQWYGSLYVAATGGGSLARVSQPVFYDSAPDGPYPQGELHAMPGSFRIEAIGPQAWRVSILVPSDWLMRSELVFPVTIDPTISNTYASNHGLNDWMNTFNASCQATMNLTLPPGPLYTVTNTSTQYSVLSKGTIAVVGFTTYYAAGFEQHTRVGYGNNWTPSQTGFGNSMSPQTVPYNIPNSNIANGCYPGGTSLQFKWQGYNEFFPIFSGNPITNLAGCVTNYHELLANTWVVTVTYDVFNLTVNPNPPAPVICSGSNAGVSLSSTPPGASLAWTVVQSGVSGAVNGSGTSIQHQLVTNGGAAGTATYTVTPTLNGCVGTPQNVVVTVNPEYTGSIQAQICSGESYSFGGNTYTAQGNYTQTFPSAAGCDSTVTLQLTVVSTLTTNISQSICDGEAFEFNGTLLEDPGTYTANLLSSGGCDSIVTLQLTVNPVYTSSFSAAICQGSSYSFGGNSYADAGDYPVVFQSAAGCDSTVTLQLTVNPPVTIETDATICEGSSYLFEGQLYDVSGTYSVTYSDAAGCDSVRVLNLVVNPVISTSVSAGICEGETYAFNGQTYQEEGVYSVTLQTQAGCDSVVVLDLQVYPPHATTETAFICEGEAYPFGGAWYTASGTYTENLQSVFGCDSVATLNLTVYEVPEVDLGPDVDLCEGESVELSNLGDSGNMTWSTGSNASSIIVGSDGDYWLHIGGQGNCFGADTVEVSVHEIPSGPVQTEFTICGGEELEIDLGNPENTYEWSTGATTPSVQITSPGTYTVLITSPWGCEREASIEVGYFCEPMVFVPNAFTPDGDGINDVLRVYGEFIAQFEWTIFNRWGEPVFHSTDPDKVWDGSFLSGSHYSPDGFYNWVLRYKVFVDAFGRESEWRDLSGHIMMVR